MLDVADLGDKDVVIMTLIMRTNIATALQCRVMWPYLARSELVNPCVLERSEASWAVAQVSSRAS